MRPPPNRSASVTRAARNAVFDEGLNKELIPFSRGSGPGDAASRRIFAVEGCGLPQRPNVATLCRLRAREGDECCPFFRRLGKRSEEHTSELQSRRDLVCRLLLEKKKNIQEDYIHMIHDPHTRIYTISSI